jgi:uncharacterized protein YlzI (FlbEa/FlbD family)
MFIVLTDFSRGDKIYINPSHIKYMETMGDRCYGTSTLVRVDEETFKVSESPTEIIDKIQKMHLGG